VEADAERLEKYNVDMDEKGCLASWVAVGSEAVLYTKGDINDEVEGDMVCLIAQLVDHCVDWFNSYAKRLNKEARTITCVAPSITPHARTNCTSLLTAIHSMLQSIGIRSIGVKEHQRRTELVFSLINQGYSTDDSWRSFIVVIAVDPIYVTVQTVFTLYGEKYKVTDPVLQSWV
jgi:hypothetical protein